MSDRYDEEHPVEHGRELRGLGRFASPPNGNAVARPGKAVTRLKEARFGRMFELPAFRPPDRLLVRLAEAMREPPDGAPTWKAYSRIPAGYITFGQFVTHDLTFDRSPVREREADPGGTRNFRSPRFDLDTVYAEPPAADVAPPRSYDPDKLRIDNLHDPSRPDDLPRGPDGRALIPDSRNDENLLICQLHLAFLKLHNRFVDDVRAANKIRPGATSESVFDEARRLSRWHYQWLIVNDYLPRIVDRRTINDIRRYENGAFTIASRFYKPKNPDAPMIPVELAAAALRFGHSMLGAAYAVRDPAQKVPVFGPDVSGPVLNGQRPIPPALEVRWDLFFKVPGAPFRPANLARALDSYLPAPLFELPDQVLPTRDPERSFSLPLRDLRRAAKYGLPSGQRIAEAMRRVDPSVPVLPNSTIFRGNPLGEAPGWEEQAPLWFYILEEARELGNGERLGPVGGRIIAEVVLKLLDLDKESYLHADPIFRPVFASAGPSQEPTVGDLLQYAGSARNVAGRPGSYR